MSRPQPWETMPGWPEWSAHRRNPPLTERKSYLYPTQTSSLSASGWFQISRCRCWWANAEDGSRGDAGWSLSPERRQLQDGFVCFFSSLVSSGSFPHPLCVEGGWIHLVLQGLAEVHVDLLHAASVEVVDGQDFISFVEQAHGVRLTSPATHTETHTSFNNHCFIIFFSQKKPPIKGLWVFPTLSHTSTENIRQSPSACYLSYRAPAWHSSKTTWLGFGCVMHAAAVSSAGAAARLGVAGGTYIGLPSTSMSVRCFFRSARLTSISLSSVEMSSRLRGGRTTECKCCRTVTQARKMKMMIVSETHLLPICYYSSPPMINHPNHCLHKPSKTAQTGPTRQPRWRRSSVSYLIVTLSDSERFFWTRCSCKHALTSPSNFVWTHSTSSAVQWERCNHCRWSCRWSLRTGGFHPCKIVQKKKEEEDFVVFLRVLLSQQLFQR